jgi:hypothetical protein
MHDVDEHNTLEASLAIAYGNCRHEAAVSIHKQSSIARYKGEASHRGSNAETKGSDV